MSVVPHAAPVDCERLVGTLLRELQEFEGKVEGIEERCRQIHQGLRSLSEELRNARASFAATSAAPAKTACVEGEIPLARLVELSGMRDHVDLVMGQGGRPDIIIHEPGGGTIAVDGQLCLASRGGAPIEETVRNHVEALRRKPRQQCPGNLMVVYVPLELAVTMADPPAGGIIIAAPSTLFMILRCISARWLSSTCARDARSLVDKGQDLVVDFSAFIADFTDNEKSLCELVESFAEAARSVAVTPALLKKG